MLLGVLKMSNYISYIQINERQYQAYISEEETEHNLSVKKYINDVVDKIKSKTGNDVLVLPDVTIQTLPNNEDNIYVAYIDTGKLPPYKASEFCNKIAEGCNKTFKGNVITMAVSKVNNYQSRIEALPIDKDNLYVLHIDTGHLGNENSQKYLEKYKNTIDETGVFKDLNYVVLQKNKNVESNIKVFDNLEENIKTSNYTIELIHYDNVEICNCINETFSFDVVEQSSGTSFVWKIRATENKLLKKTLNDFVNHPINFKIKRSFFSKTGEVIDEVFYNRFSDLSMSYDLNSGIPSDLIYTIHCSRCNIDY